MFGRVEAPPSPALPQNCFSSGLITVNMFYSEAILSRRGPLARVWLAAHWERKLSKTQTLQTDISESVDAIMEQDIQVMAPRLSGQLLLGVVRIYSRKAKYLLDDCNEALLKIKMAFRPGVVDMTEDQLVVSRNAITLQPDGLDLDLMLPDLNLDLDFEPQTGGQHIARQADITLATADDLQLDMDDIGYDFDLGPADGIGSQDFELDLGLDFGDGPKRDEGEDIDDSMSVEVAREAITLRDPRDSLDSALLGNVDFDKDMDIRSIHSREPSEVPLSGGILDLDMDPGIDLDLGIDFGEHQLFDIVPPFGKEKDSRASSPLTELPPTPPPELTPRSAAKAAGQATPKPAAKKAKDKKQIFDSVIELPQNSSFGRGREDAPGSQSQKDLSEILTKQYFLPASRTMMRLLEIRSDPVSHFMPTRTAPNGSLLFSAGPPGLAPQLSELFMRPITNLSLSSRRRREGSQERPSKKLRLDETANGDVSDIELARQAGDVVQSIGIGSDIIPDLGAGIVDFGTGNGAVEDFQLDVEFPLDTSGDAINMDLPSKIGNETRQSTPAVDFAEDAQLYTDANCPIAMFDAEPSQSQAAGLTQEEDEAVTEKDQSKGYSKNTIQALSILQKELDSITELEAGEKVLSFAQMSEKATRRAASSFFFELLVLSTRDCIKVSQSAPFENIEIRAKDKLWEHNVRTIRQASVAPSITSTFGL